MTTRYVIAGGRVRMTGTLSSGELPDLMYNFEHAAQLRDGFVRYENKALVANRGDRTVRLRVLPYNGFVPGKPVNEAIVLAMNEALS